MVSLERKDWKEKWGMGKSQLKASPDPTGNLEAGIALQNCLE